MDPPYAISSSAILECALEGVVEGSFCGTYPVKHQIERNNWTTTMSLLPILQIVAPTAPKLGSARGDLVPMVTYEKEVVRSLLQTAKGRLEDDIPMENVPRYFGWERGYVQQRVSNAFEVNRTVLSSRCPPICCSKIRMDSMLVSWFILASSRVRTVEVLGHVCLHPWIVVLDHCPASLNARDRHFDMLTPTRNAHSDSG